MRDEAVQVSPPSRKRKYSDCFWNAISGIPPGRAEDVTMAPKRAKLTGDRPHTRSQPSQSLIVTLKVPGMITNVRNSRNSQSSRKVEQLASEGPSPDQPEPKNRSLPDLEDISVIQSLLKDNVDCMNRAFCQSESLRRDIQSLKEPCTTSDSNESSLQQRIKALENENEDLKTNLILMQNRCLKDMQNGGWAPKEDRLIRQEFAMLQEDISIWSKSHGIMSLSELKKSSKAAKTRFIHDLHAAGCCSEEKWDFLIEKSAALKDKIPILVLQAFVANDIFKKIFNPFFPFLFSSEGILNGDAATHLDRIYKEMMAVNSPEAHIWRSQVLRVLSASLKKSMDISFTKPSIAGLKNAPSFLFPSTSDVKTRTAELHKIYIKATKLAQSLWTQREYQMMLTLKDRPVFQSSKTAMVAHRLHHLDDGDQRLDGRQVLLCIQPGILGIGNSNAEDYNKAKVWAKAIMLVDETEEETEVDEIDDQA